MDLKLDRIYGRREINTDQLPSEMFWTTAAEKKKLQKNNYEKIKKTSFLGLSANKWTPAKRLTGSWSLSGSAAVIRLTSTAESR